MPGRELYATGSSLEVLSVVFLPVADKGAESSLCNSSAMHSRNTRLSCLRLVYLCSSERIGALRFSSSFHPLGCTVANLDLEMLQRMNEFPCYHNGKARALTIKLNTVSRGNKSELFTLVDGKTGLYEYCFSSV